MCNESDLKNHIQELQVGKVEQINFVYDYSPLVKLYEKRDSIVQSLEVLYSKTCGIDINLFDSNDIQSVHLKVNEKLIPPSDDYILYNPDVNTSDLNEDKYYILATDSDKYNAKKKKCFKITKSNRELIDSYSRELVSISDEISLLRGKADFTRLPIAFVTMDSVTDAQMAAQAVFSPKVFELITELAPAPLDVNWNNLLLDSKSVFLRKNVIEFIIIVFSCLLIIPIRYITSLLNVNSIRKIWKEFGDYLIKHEKVRTAVTGLLPTYLFTIINVVLPYVISLLSNLQGLGSKGDVELSVIKKNFLYIFFNLFLVFTLFGTLSSYKALLTDTTKIAPLLATSIKSLSLFYIDLILLQGLTMFPFKLLQIGDLCTFFWSFVINFKTRTPRLYREYLYKPQIFDLGLILPQHILIFIITVLYSSISTKILVSGLVYFILGFYTYKYQLVYSLVHPYHSTGKAWPIIFKRVCLGVFFLHLQMFGSLALEQSFVLAGLMLPLFPSTVVALMFFDRNYNPLLHYIALDAIKTRGKSVESESEDGIDSLLINSGLSQDRNIKRKSSVVSLRHFLDGDDECDAVLLNSSLGNSQEASGNHENAILSDENEEAVQTFNESNDNLSPHSSKQADELKNRDTPNDIAGSSVLVSPSLLTSNLSAIPLLTTKSHVNRKHSTIEEERESTQSYVHPCLLDDPTDVIVGFSNDSVDYLKFRVKFNETNGLSESQRGAVHISRDDRDQDGIEETEGDLEAVRGKVMGFVTRDYPVEEIF
ncbi:hypothetical protein PMKS-003382 [Pichia membranifaciens]|uniref:CSC1/OSCA1-like 7TM region domain-containing protein n=1 Tax=Pichia membranifaciens TaxID=4926 RepID=A0A1Q2YJY3_9ASCO|nr:hypothetical protein PMKS-003382 [Pichia membranifaciens]